MYLNKKINKYKNILNAKAWNNMTWAGIKKKPSLTLSWEPLFRYFWLGGDELSKKVTSTNKQPNFLQDRPASLKFGI